MEQCFERTVTVIHEDRLVSLTPYEFPVFAKGTDLIITNPPFSKNVSVLEWLVSLGIPFMALLPFDWKGNKKSGAFIREHKIQEIV
eukprot:SAG22_NODE_11021_length_504_cov_24.997531_1_plen_85_part_10